MAKDTKTENVHDPIRSEAIERLTQEVHTLRLAVDELREELAWEIRQLRQSNSEWKPLRLTSFPADPTAPDFHERVNAATRGTAPSPEDSFNAFIQDLISEPAFVNMDTDDWGDMDEFPPGEVIAIDQATLEWLTYNQIIAGQEANWVLIDDRAGWFYLLWSTGTQHFLRMLTDDQQQQVTRLTGLAPIDEMLPEDIPLANPVANPKPTTTERQRSLWCDIGDIIIM